MINSASFVASTSGNYGDVVIYKSSWTQLNEKNITINASPSKEVIPQDFLDKIKPYFDQLKITNDHVASAYWSVNEEGQRIQSTQEDLKVKHANIVIHIPFKLEAGQGPMDHKTNCLNRIAQHIAELVRQSFPNIKPEKSSFLIVQPNGLVFSLISKLQNPNTQGFNATIGIF